MSSTTPTPAPLKKRSVVSSFIFKTSGTPDGKPQVALFRRSDRVSTYQNHLAPISGSIDPTDETPLAAAWRELSEETTLTGANLVLLRHGPQYTFADPSVGREWTIYPFAFGLRSPADEARIRIDWEHREWGWYDPLRVEDSAAFGGVPNLAKSLRRVWFEKDLGEAAAGVLAKGLAGLAMDHESGARQLAGMAVRVLRGVVSELEADPGEALGDWWWRVRFAAWHLCKNGRESMGAAIQAALVGVLAGVRGVVEAPPASGAGAFREAVLRVFDEALAAREKTTAAVAEALSGYLAREFPVDGEKPLVVLTLSQSSTIAAGLLRVAATRAVELRVLESRPLFEGVALAGMVAGSLGRGSRVRVYTDAAAGLASAGVDVVLLGADRVAESGAASNKTGSLPAVLSARHVAQQQGRQVKVVVVGDSEKVAPPGRTEDHVVEENDGAMVSRAWVVNENKAAVKASAETLAGPELGRQGVNVEVSNIFFEWVPPDLIDVYITEWGELTLDGIAERSHNLGDEIQQTFESL